MKTIEVKFNNGLYSYSKFLYYISNIVPKDFNQSIDIAEKIMVATEMLYNINGYLGIYLNNYS